LKNIDQISIKIKKIILDTAYKAGNKSAHIGGALSLSDIFAVMFASKSLNFKPNDPLWADRDRVILSKGHSCLAYYALLNLMGFISEQDLELFECDGADLLGHPVKNTSKGIEFSTGSLGMGISISVGIAISAKLKSKNFKVYSILGDGELNEGSVWEALMCASKFQLKNLIFIIDKNNYQQTGSTKSIMINENLKKKLSSFDLDVIDIDGHNYKEIENALSFINSKPKIIIANTIKGKGFSFAENNNSWHHSVITDKIYNEAIKQLDFNENK
jgi:transketolase